MPQCPLFLEARSTVFNSWPAEWPHFSYFSITEWPLYSTSSKCRIFNRYIDEILAIFNGHQCPFENKMNGRIFAGQNSLVLNRRRFYYYHKRKFIGILNAFWMPAIADVSKCLNARNMRIINWMVLKQIFQCIQLFQLEGSEACYGSSTGQFRGLYCRSLMCIDFANLIPKF